MQYLLILLLVVGALAVDQATIIRHLDARETLNSFQREDSRLNATCSGQQSGVYVIPCCPDAQNCFDTSDNCVDSSGIFTFTPPTEQGASYARFQFKVGDTTSCSIPVSLVTSQGQILMDVLVKEGSGETSLFSELQENSFVLCCSDILKKTPAWDGTVTILTLSIFTPGQGSHASFSLQIYPTSDSLPPPFFFNQAKLLVSLISAQYSCGPNTAGPCKYRLLATEEPLYDYLKSAATPADIRGRLVSDRIVWSIPLSTINVETQEVIELLDPALINNDFYSIVLFQNILNSSGLPYNTFYSTQPYQNVCLNQRVKELNEEFQSADRAFISTSVPSGIFNLPVSENLDPVELYLEATFNYVVAPFFHSAFVSCQAFADDVLTFKRVSAYKTEIQYCTAYYGTPEFDNDHCCNPSVNGCCVGKNVTIPVFEQSVSQNIFVECTQRSDSCALSEVSKYILTQDIQATCPTKFEKDYLSIIYDQCLSQISLPSCSRDLDCQSQFGLNSLCIQKPELSILSSLYQDRTLTKICTIPCDTDTDCLYGICVQHEYWKECSYSYGNNYLFNRTTYAMIFADCLGEKMLELPVEAGEKYFSAVGFADSTIPSLVDLSNALWHIDPEFVCSTELQPGSTATASDCTKLTCNWNDCDSSSIITTCNASSCGYPPFRGNYFCGKLLGPNPRIYPEISQSGTCLYINRDYASATDTCDSSGCYRNVPDQASCFDNLCHPDDLIPLSEYLIYALDGSSGFTANGSVCPPICYLFINQSECVEQGGKMSKQGDKCLFEAHDYRNCFAHPATWWPGAIYMPEKFDDLVSCKSHCVGNPFVGSKAQCLYGSHCSISTCAECDRASCVESGYCSAMPGCYFPLDRKGNCDRPTTIHGPLTWTPEGCVLPFSLSFWLSQESCQTLGGRSRSYEDWKALTESDCNGMGSICYQANSPLPLNTTTIWPGYRLVPPSDCLACGGTPIPAFDWIKGQWVNNTEEDWVDLQWMQRAMTYKSSPEFRTSKENFLEFFRVSDVDRRIEQLSSRYSCRYAGVTESLPDLACLCRGTNDSEVESCGCHDDRPITTGRISVCEGVNKMYPITTSVEGAYLLVSANLEFRNDTCVEFDILTVEKTPYLVNTSSFIASERSYNAHNLSNLHQFGLILNSHGQEIGVIAGDGIILSPLQNLSQVTKKRELQRYTNDIAFCYDFTALNTSAIEFPFTNVSYYGMGVCYFDQNASECTPPLIIIETYIPLSSSNVCFPFYPDYAYFPLALVDDQNLTYQQRLPTGSYAFCIVLIIIYIVAILALIGITVYAVKLFKKHALMAAISAIIAILALACIFDHAPDNEVVTLWMIEVPATLMWTIASINLWFWLVTIGRQRRNCRCTKTCCCSKLKEVVLASLIITSIIFITYLVFALYPIGSQIPGSYLTDQSAQVASIWFAVWVTLNGIIVLWLISILIYRGIRKLYKPTTTGQKHPRPFFITVLATCIVFLAQSTFILRVFLFYPIWSWSIVAVCAYLVVIDLLPLFLFGLLFFWGIKVFKRDVRYYVSDSSSDDNPVITQQFRTQLLPNELARVLSGTEPSDSNQATSPHQQSPLVGLSESAPVTKIAKKKESDDEDQQVDTHNKASDEDGLELKERDWNDRPPLNDSPPRL